MRVLIKVLLSVFMLIMFSAVSMMAQNSISNKRTNANVQGIVKCKGEKVPYISVYIEGTTIGTLTDDAGSFIIKHLPPGKYTIFAGGIGYKTTSEIIEVKPNKTIDIILELEEDVLNLEAALITGDRQKTNRKESSVVVTAVNTTVLKRTQSLNVAEGINFTPGLRTEINCQNCGFSQLRMNGMEGAYSQILINSHPVFSGLAGVYGLELIPTNMIERLEVVRGGGSSLFGGNAIAGTVNIITKEPVKNTIFGDFRTALVGLSPDGGKSAIDGQIDLNASLVSDNGKTGGYIYGTMRNRGAYDANNDGFSELVKMENTTFGFNMFHKPGINNKITIDGYRISEFRRGGNNLNLLPHQADVTEQLRHLISAGTITYDQFVNNNKDMFSLYASAQHVKRNSYYGALQEPNAYGLTTNLTGTVGGHYIINMKKFLFAPSTTTVGFSNVNDYLIDNKLGVYPYTQTLLINQFVNTTGVFLKHDWKTYLFNISLGLRGDYYFIKDNQADNSAKPLNNFVLSPRVSLLYKALDNLRFRLGYAKGYRAPQVFNEDLHVELVNASRVQTINSDSLVQENSHSVTNSIDFDFALGQTTNDLLVEGFYTILKNPFANRFTELENKPGEYVYIRENATDGAYVVGANIEFNSYVSSYFNYQLGFTIQKSRYISPQPWGDEEGHESKSFVRTPNRYGYAVFSFTPFNNFNLDLSLNYTGPMLVPHFGLYAEDFEQPEEATVVAQHIANGDIIQGEELVKSKDLLVVNLLIAYDINLTNETSLQIYAGVKNIFNQIQKDWDRGPYRDAGFIYGQQTFRTINIGVKLGQLN